VQYEVYILCNLGNTYKTLLFSLPGIFSTYHILKRLYCPNQYYLIIDFFSICANLYETNITLDMPLISNCVLAKFSITSVLYARRM